jgi:hypothetical protein
MAEGVTRTQRVYHASEMLRRSAEAIVALPGLALLALAWRATPAWFERHIAVPEYYWPMSPGALPSLRLILVVAGLTFPLVLSPLVGDSIKRRGLSETVAAAARIGVAMILALIVCELVLEAVAKPDIDAPHPRLESRLGQNDPRLGWIFAPHKSFDVKMRKETPQAHYEIDRYGDRARSKDWQEDPARPTIILTGESCMYGHGLDWKDTIAARLEELTGAQVVVTAVGGYGNDQAYLRALEALNRLRHPVLVVSLVLPVMLTRNLHDYRPRLELVNGALVPAPARKQLELRNLVFNELRYTRSSRLDYAVRLAHAIFAETVKAASAHGARALFLQQSIDGPPPALMTALLLDLPHADVTLQRSQLIPWDGHPNAEGALLLARAIAQYVNSP